jgi:hypothetical protein
MGEVQICSCSGSGGVTADFRNLRGVGSIRKASGSDKRGIKKILSRFG